MSTNQIVLHKVKAVGGNGPAQVQPYPNMDSSRVVLSAAIHGIMNRIVPPQSTMSWSCLLYTSDAADDPRVV